MCDDPNLQARVDAMEEKIDIIWERLNEEWEQEWIRGRNDASET